MSDKSARKKIVAREVLEHAARLFAQKGYANTSLQDVAEAVGLSRSSIYYYYPNKTALLKAMVDDVSVVGARTLSGIRNDTKGLEPGERLRRAVEALVLWGLERPMRFKVIDRSEEILPAEISRIHETAKRQVLAVMKDLIAEGIEAGVLRPVDPRNAALALIGMGNWTAWWWTPKSKQTKEEVATFIGDMAIAALRRVGPSRPSGHSIEDAIELLRDDLSFLELIVSSNGSGIREEAPRNLDKKRTTKQI